MKYDRHKGILFLAVLLLLGSCLRRETEKFGCLNEKRFDFENECKSLSEPKKKGGDLAVSLRITPHSFVGATFDELRFNPGNSNQISYYQWDADKSEGIRGFVILDLLSGSRLPIGLEFPYGLSYDWDDKGNIFLPGEGIVRFNTIGGDIEVVEIPGLFDRPAWIPGSNKVGIAWDGDGVASFRYYLTYDFDTRILDTFDAFHEIGGFPSDMSWTSKEVVNGFEGKKGLAFFDPEIGKKERLVTYATMRRTDEDRITKYKWHPNGERLYYCVPGQGIFYSSIHNKKEVMVKKSCGNWMYSDFDISSDGKKIVARVDRIELGDPPDYGVSEYEDWWYISQSIRTMSIDGCDEKIILE